MAVHRLVLDTIIDEQYELIAVHSPLASFKLVFLLNKYLKFQLSRTEKDIYLEKNNILNGFTLFQYEDNEQYHFYSFIGNKCTTTTLTNSKEGGLFGNSQEYTNTTKYLIPEMKNIDYLLKIETETNQFSVKSLLSKVLLIPQISTAYTIDSYQLKSKNNLIF